jgi:manganese efflux pump family protein
MDLLTIILISIALAMDAFSISITKGFTLKNITKIQTLWIGIFFGGFQALMPFLGYICGIYIDQIVSTIAPWVAFLILLGIGLKMIYESLNKDDTPSDDREYMEDREDFEGSEINPKKNMFSFTELILLAIATSIDAFTVGISFAILNTSIIISIILIGLITFALTEIGVYIGQKIGHYLGDKFEIVGGIILVILGVKILLNGLGIN